MDIKTLPPDEFGEFYQAVCNTVFDAMANPGEGNKSLMGLMEDYQVSFQIPDSFSTAINSSLQTNLYAPATESRSGCAFCSLCAICG
jgi:hypothetical protein